MEEGETVDVIDENILRILSLYDHLTPLQLWYEFGEDDLGKRRLTEAELLSKLESLRVKGFVEIGKGAEVGGGFSHVGCRVENGITGK